MSIDYYLIVPSDRWPTHAELQAALDQDGHGIRMLARDGVDTQSVSAIPVNVNKFAFFAEQELIEVYCTVQPLEQIDFEIIDFGEGDIGYENAAVAALMSVVAQVNVGDIEFHLEEGPTPYGWGSVILMFTTFVRHFDARFIDPMDGEVYGRDNIQPIVDMGLGLRGLSEAESSTASNNWEVHRDNITKDGSAANKIWMSPLPILIGIVVILFALKLIPGGCTQSENGKINVGAQKLLGTSLEGSVG